MAAWCRSRIAIFGSESIGLCSFIKSSAEVGGSTSPMRHRSPSCGLRQTSGRSRGWGRLGERAAEVVRRWWKAPAPWQMLGATGPSAT